MVAVTGFPRQLRVGDADGQDVVAYKRTVSRAGRWPWQSFDDTFSKAFSTGNGPNVINTGVAGVQRQQNMPDNGIVDEKTFNLLRSIRIPDGLPHAGEPAMDATAATLISQAYVLMHPAPSASTRDKALAAALGWLGYKESPSGSNNTVFGNWYGMNYSPWCAMFATYCFEVEAGGSASFAQGSRYAYVPYIVSDARNGLHGLTVASSPIPGDLVCFDWHRDGTYDHVGIFESGSPSSFTSVEGNTSTSNNSNGGEVMRRSRDNRSQDTVFVRVAES
jgi:hypothetical protein